MMPGGCRSIRSTDPLCFTFFCVCARAHATKSMANTLTRTHFCRLEKKGKRLSPTNQIAPKNNSMILHKCINATMHKCTFNWEIMLSFLSLFDHGTKRGGCGKYKKCDRSDPPCCPIWNYLMTDVVIESKTRKQTREEQKKQIYIVGYFLFAPVLCECVCFFKVLAEMTSFLLLFALHSIKNTPQDEQVRRG